MKNIGRILHEAALARALERNKNRRAEAVVELNAAREELAQLVKRGEAIGVPKTRIARAAGISRERLYDIIRDVPHRSRHGYAGERGERFVAGFGLGIDDEARAPVEQREGGST